MILLDIKNLTLEIDISSQWVKALDKINIVIHEGQIHALVGESGSGKSLIVKAIVGALPDRWRITADRMTWKGQNLLTMSLKARRNLIRQDISVIFQNPLESLDPYLTLGKQLTEMIPSEKFANSSFWQKKKDKQLSFWIFSTVFNHHFRGKVSIPKDADRGQNCYSYRRNDSST